MTFKRVLEKKEFFLFFICSLFTAGFLFCVRKSIPFSSWLVGISLEIIILSLLFILYFVLFSRMYRKKFLADAQGRYNLMRRSQIESEEARQRLVDLLLPGYLEAKDIINDIGKNLLLEKYTNETIESCGKLGQAIENSGATFEVQEVYLPDIIKLIRECFSYELTKKSIDIGQFGAGFYTSGAQPQIYYFLYNIFKEIIHRVPESGQLHIYFEEKESTQLIKIVDNGFFLPEELKKSQSQKRYDEIDSLCSLTNEETKKLCSSLGWEILEERNALKQNLTIIKWKKAFLKGSMEEKVIFLKDNPKFRSYIKNREQFYKEWKV